MRSAVPCSRQRATRRSKLAAPVVEITGVDAHLLYIFSRHEGRLRHEMDIGHQRHGASLLLQPGADRGEVRRLAASLCGEPHDLAARPGNAPHLRRRGLGIVRVGVGHRLDPHGIPPADHHASHRHRTGGRTRISGKRIAIFSHGALFIESSFISGSPSAKRSPGTLSLPLPSPPFPASPALPENRPRQPTGQSGLKPAGPPDSDHGLKFVRTARKLCPVAENGPGTSQI